MKQEVQDIAKCLTEDKEKKCFTKRELCAAIDEAFTEHEWSAPLHSDMLQVAASIVEKVFGGRTNDK